MVTIQEIVSLLHSIKSVDGAAVERAIVHFDNLGNRELTFKEFKNVIESFFSD